MKAISMTIQRTEDIAKIKKALDWVGCLDYRYVDEMDNCADEANEALERLATLPAPPPEKA